MSGPETLLDCFYGAVSKGHDPLLCARTPGGWRPTSPAELDRRVRATFAGLRALGLSKGDRVAILSENRPEWAIADFASLAAGAATVPVYTTYPVDQVAYLLKDSGAKIAFCSTTEAPKILAAKPSCPGLEHVVVFDGGEGTLNLDELAARGAGSDPAAFDASAKGVSPDDLATLVYTSGTTGEPKGAMLTHGNFLSNIGAASTLYELHPGEVCLSFLPIAHVFERAVDYFCFRAGLSIWYLDSVEQLPQALGEVRPHTFAAVPRVYEKMHARILEALEKASPLRRKIFRWAISLGMERLSYLQSGSALPTALAVRLKLADRLVFSKVRARLGGRFRFCISGGAPLGKELAEFFWAAGLELYEGYGLTETAPILSCNRPDAWRLGTVGKALPGVTLKIAPDGEILAKGPNVMRGYWEKPAETKATFDAEGWFLTGDVGFLDPEGYLTITDRKKEIIVSAYGKNTAPAPIENALKAVPYVSAAAVLGDRRKFLAALLVPDFDKLAEALKKQGVVAADRAALAAHPEAKRLVQEGVDVLNRKLPHESQIRVFTLLPRDFSIDSGELTPTLKIKRRVIQKGWAAAIEKMYQEAEASPR